MRSRGEAPAILSRTLSLSLSLYRTLGHGEGKGAYLRTLKYRYFVRMYRYGSMLMPSTF